MIAITNLSSTIADKGQRMTWLHRYVVAATIFLVGSVYISMSAAVITLTVRFCRYLLTF